MDHVTAVFVEPVTMDENCWAGDAVVIVTLVGARETMTGLKVFMVKTDQLPNVEKTLEFDCLLVADFSMLPFAAREFRPVPPASPYLPTQAPPHGAHGAPRDGRGQA